MTITTKRTDDDAIQTLEITTAKGKTGSTYYYVNGKHTNIDRLAKKVCANPNLFALKTVRGTFTFAGKIPVKNRFAGHFGAKDIIAYNYTFISDDASVSVERSAQCLKEDDYIAFRKAIQCMCDITWYYSSLTKFTPAEIEEIDPSEYAVFPDAHQVAIDAEIELANNNTTDNVEIKITKNGNVNFFLNGKRVKEFEIVYSVIENGGTHYESSYLSYSGVSNNAYFLSPITAYNWLKAQSAKNRNVADGSWMIKRYDANGESIILEFTGSHNVINDPQLQNYIDAKAAADNIAVQFNCVKHHIEYLINHGLTEEQAQQIIIAIHADKANNGTVNNIIEEFKAQNSVEVKHEIAETDNSEEDNELDEVWELIPSADALNDEPELEDELVDEPVETKEIIGNDILLFRNGKIAEIESLKYGAWLEFHNDGIRYFTYGGYGSHFKGKFNGDCDRWDFDDFMNILAERGAVDDNNKPAEPVNNDFSSQLEELKIQQAVAQFDYEQKKIAFRAAQKAKQDAANKLDSIERQIDELRANAVKVLNDTLITEDLILAPQMQVTNHNGDSRLINFNQITIFTLGEKFHISCERFPIGEYDTPEQVTLVINRLKDAINRGDNHFKFSTVDELNNLDDVNQSDEPPPIDKAALDDSLIRGMIQSLENYKAICQKALSSKSIDLPNIQYELELYNIQRNALFGKVVA